MTDNGEVLLDPMSDVSCASLSDSVADLKTCTSRDELIDFLNEKIFKLEADNKEMKNMMKKLGRMIEEKETDSWWKSLELKLDRTIILGLSLCLSYMSYNSTT